MSTLIGNPAPSFDLACTRITDPARSWVSLGDYRGRWLILVFYADRHPQWHTDDSSRVPHPSSVTTRASRPISIPAQRSASTDTTRSPV